VAARGKAGGEVEVMVEVAWETVGGKEEVKAAEEVKVLEGENKAGVLMVKKAKMADAVIGVEKQAEE